MKSNYVLPLIGLVLIGGFIWWARPANNSTLPNESDPHAHEAEPISSIAADTITLNEQSHDFGVISMAAGKVSTNFSLTNVSSSSIRTSKLYTSCMCTTARFIQSGKESEEFGMPGHGFLKPMEGTIAPGETVQIVVTFDPAAHGPAGVGKIGRAVRLETDKGALEVSFTADVTP